MDRRTLLRSAGGVGVLTLGGCLGGSGSDGSNESTTEGGDAGDGTEGPQFGDWFRGTSNFDGAVDRAGQDEVTVRVGAEGNGGNLAFAPAAVRVSTGTTVVWEWTGQGGLHNVVEQDGAFESELRNADYTFEQTFTEPGTVLYLCSPHRSQGMRGAVVVGEN